MAGRYAGGAKEGSGRSVSCEVADVEMEVAGSVQVVRWWRWVGDFGDAWMVVRGSRKGPAVQLCALVDGAAAHNRLRLRKKREK